MSWTGAAAASLAGGLATQLFDVCLHCSGQVGPEGGEGGAQDGHTQGWVQVFLSSLEADACHNKRDSVEDAAGHC